MEVKHNFLNFPVHAYINKRTDTEDITIGEVFCWDEVEHCIIQALDENDPSYYLLIGDKKIDLIDEDIFDIVDKMYPQCTAYPMYSYNVMMALRDRNKGKKSRDILDHSMEKYNEFYGNLSV